jgi:hypothetical protein
VSRVPCEEAGDQPRTCCLYNFSFTSNTLSLLTVASSNGWMPQHPVSRMIEARDPFLFFFLSFFDILRFRSASANWTIRAECMRRRRCHDSDCLVLEISVCLDILQTFVFCSRGNYVFSLFRTRRLIVHLSLPEFSMAPINVTVLGCVRATILRPSYTGQ